jgi:hypothetical protein
VFTKVGKFRQFFVSHFLSFELLWHHSAFFSTSFEPVSPNIHCWLLQFRSLPFWPFVICSVNSLWSTYHECERWHCVFTGAHRAQPRLSAFVCGPAPSKRQGLLSCTGNKITSSFIVPPAPPHF